MKTIKILTLCLITTLGFAQNKQSKTTQTIKVNKDVVVDLNTNLPANEGAISATGLSGVTALTITTTD